MKVKELIEELQKLDQEKEIALSTKRGEAFSITKIEYDNYIKEYIIKSR